MKFEENINHPRKFVAEVRASLNRLLQEGVENLLDPSSMNEAVEDDHEISKEEQAVIDKLQKVATALGSEKEFSYIEGQLSITFKSKQAASDFMAHLEECPEVDSYDVNVISRDASASDEPIDFDTFEDDDHNDFLVFVYLDPEIVTYAPSYDEIDADEGLDALADAGGLVTEVVRKVKINFKGKRRIKMQCRPGFRWNPQMRTCQKIGGAELATKRKALRQAVRTKKAQGTALLRRVNRKTKRAMKFRKSFGLE